MLILNGFESSTYGGIVIVLPRVAMNNSIATIIFALYGHRTVIMI